RFATDKVSLPLVQAQQCPTWQGPPPISTAVRNPAPSSRCSNPLSSSSSCVVCPLLLLLLRWTPWSKVPNNPNPIIISKSVAVLHLESPNSSNPITIPLPIRARGVNLSLLFYIVVVVVETRKN
ncbi:AAEL004354-PA, partial [Aedes aegypti]